MKKLFALLLSLTMVFSLCALSVFGATEGPETGSDPLPEIRSARSIPYVPGATYETTASVNMRKGAGLEYAVVVKLSSGTVTTGLDEEEDADGDQWIKVRVDSGSSKGKTGWVSSMYLELTEAARY